MVVELLARTNVLGAKPSTPNAKPEFIITVPRSFTKEQINNLIGNLVNKFHHKKDSFLILPEANTKSRNIKLFLMQAEADKPLISKEFKNTEDLGTRIHQELAKLPMAKSKDSSKKLLPEIKKEAETKNQIVKFNNIEALKKIHICGVNCDEHGKGNEEIVEKLIAEQDYGSHNNPQAKTEQASKQNIDKTKVLDQKQIDFIHNRISELTKINEQLLELRNDKKSIQEQGNCEEDVYKNPQKPQWLPTFSKHDGFRAYKILYNENTNTVPMTDPDGIESEHLFPKFHADILHPGELSESELIVRPIFYVEKYLQPEIAKLEATLSGKTTVEHKDIVRNDTKFAEVKDESIKQKLTKDINNAFKALKNTFKRLNISRKAYEREEATKARFEKVAKSQSNPSSILNGSSLLSSRTFGFGNAEEDLIRKNSEKAYRDLENSFNENMLSFQKKLEKGGFEEISSNKESELSIELSKELARQPEFKNTYREENGKRVLTDIKQVYYRALIGQSMPIDSDDSMKNSDENLSIINADDYYFKTIGGLSSSSNAEPETLSLENLEEIPTEETIPPTEELTKDSTEESTSQENTDNIKEEPNDSQNQSPEQ